MTLRNIFLDQFLFQAVIYAAKLQWHTELYHWESVAGSVIQATGTVEFEDGLRMVVLLGGCWGP